MRTIFYQYIIDDQPYYFELIPRAIISKSQQKQQGQFKFHVYKMTQQVDFTRQAVKGDFDKRRMQVSNVKLNFFLPNYITGKNTNAKFIFQLSSQRQQQTEQSQLGSYSIDTNVYIQHFKRTSQNHFAQLWPLSETYSVQIEIFFAESRYLLEQLLKINRNKPMREFNKALVSKALEKERKEEIEEEIECQDQKKYNEKRMELMNKYAGAIVGHGGYRIFTEEEEWKMEKKPYQQSPLKQQLNKSAKLTQSMSQRPRIKRTQSITICKPHQQFSPNQIKNIKYLILIVVILILMGLGYFVSKVFLNPQPELYVTLDKVGNHNEVGYRESSVKKSSSQKQKRQKQKKAKKEQL